MNNESEGARTAKEVVDDAIRENEKAAWLMYSFAILFVLVGLVVLILATMDKNTLSGALGLVASALFWPSMTSARRTRRENIAIRLLEAPLSRFHPGL